MKEACQFQKNTLIMSWFKFCKKTNCTVDFAKARGRALASNCILEKLSMVPAIILGKYVDSIRMKRMQKNTDTTSSKTQREED